MPRIASNGSSRHYSSQNVRQDTAHEQAPPTASKGRVQQAHLFEVEPFTATTSSGDDLEKTPAEPIPASESVTLPAAEGSLDVEIPAPVGVLAIPVKQLEALPTALRRSGTKRHRERLRASLRRGQIKPIQVRPLGEGRYQILDGHDVVEILSELGYHTVKAEVQHIVDPVEVLRHVLATNFAQKNWRPGDLVMDIPGFIAFTGGGLRQYELAYLLGVDEATFSEYRGIGLRLTDDVFALAHVDPVCAANELRSISRDDYRVITEPEDDLGVAIRLSYRVHGEAPQGVPEEQAKKHRPKEKPISEVRPSKRLKDPRITATARPRRMTRTQIEAHLTEYADELFALCGDGPLVQHGTGNEATEQPTEQPPLGLEEVSEAAD